MIVISNTPKRLANIALDPVIQIGDSQELAIKMEYNQFIGEIKIEPVKGETAGTMMKILDSGTKYEGYDNLSYADAIFFKKE